MRAGGLAIFIELDDRLARISADNFLALIEHFPFAVLDKVRMEHSWPGQVIDAELIEEPAIGTEGFFAGDDGRVVAEAEVFGNAKLHARLNDVAEDGFFLQVILKFRQMFLVHPRLENASGMM